MSFNNFLFGSGPKTEQISALTPEQQDLLANLIDKIMSGSGGFGFDEDFFQKSFVDSALQEFDQRIAPQIQQKAIGGGFGGATSGINSSIAQEGARLEGNLASKRGDLLNQALDRGLQASGLALGTKPFGLQQTEGSSGLFGDIASGIGGGFAGGFGKQAGQAAGNAASNLFRGFRR